MSPGDAERDIVALVFSTAGSKGLGIELFVVLARVVTTMVFLLPPRRAHTGARRAEAAGANADPRLHGTLTRPAHDSCKGARMKLEVLERGETNAWIRLEGRLDVKGVEEIELLFTVRAGRAGKPVVVDLEAVSFVGSIAIGMFVSATRTLGLSGFRMVLFGATPLIDEVLRIAGLDQVATIVATEDEARAAIGKK